MKLRDRIIIAVVLIALLGFTLSGTLVHLLTEAWWFDAVDFASVFWTRITWQILLWVGGFVLYAAFLGGNYAIAQRFTRHRRFEFLEGTEFEPYSRGLVRVAAVFLIFTISLGAATVAHGSWEVFLKYLNQSQFAIADPIYNRDVGFYIFQLPLYETLQDWLLSLFVWGLAIAVAIYLLKGQFRGRYDWKHFFTGQAKTHISILMAAIAATVAIGFLLDRYELLLNADGVVFGAGYTDVHARIFADWAMAGLSIILAGSFILSIWQNSLTFPIVGLVIYMIALVLLTSAYPAFQQQITVEPNELEKERPYIAHNIEFTQKAYDLPDVQRRDFPAESDIDRQTLADNQATVRNVRLWDYRPLLSTYRQLQEIRLYYRFNDVDIDRYTLDGNYRQVMLSPRELVYEQVPAEAQTWVNQRLKYTHGYGLAMSPVNQVTPDGLPELFIRDIPPVSTVDLEIEEPAIYYGERTDNYIFTNTDTPEFDFPQSGENAFTFYEGDGGVPVGSLGRRLAYAYDRADLNLLISGYFNEDSKILYHRNIRDRVARVAPFLRLDNDPYMTVIDGQQYWIVDAYTVSDRYPYSKPLLQSNNVGAILEGGNIEAIARGNANYIRNSVKVVVDAFDGDMRFFVMDETDPVLQTYRKIFPSLFIAKDEIPADVKDHFRYPLDLFTIQAQIYLSYHMSDPQVFYNQEDLWRFPTEVYEGNQQLMEPYYLIMELPEEEGEEFVLILPFTPVNKDNMIAWMAARSDGEDYGRLLLYEFPKQKVIYGPSQIEARIDQNPTISQQLTLWSQEGSRVIRGDLLVIPIEESLLYVEPVYLRAEQGELPELKRVIVAYNKEVVMSENLERSLALLFGEQAEEEQPAPAAVTRPQVPENIAQLTNSILEKYQQAQEARRQNNWTEYGRYMQEFEQLLNQLRQSQNNGNNEEQ